MISANAEWCPRWLRTGCRRRQTDKPVLIINHLQILKSLLLDFKVHKLLIINILYIK